MTKKHFRELAKRFHAIKACALTKGEKSIWELSVEHTAQVCAQANPNFNREKFLTACREGL